MPIGNPPSIQFSRRENSPLYFNICTYSPLAYVFKRFSKIKFVKKKILEGPFSKLRLWELGMFKAIVTISSFSILGHVLIFLGPSRSCIVQSGCR